MEIESERLRLIALSAAQLEGCLADPAQVSEALGVLVSDAILGHPVPRAMRMKLEIMAGVSVEMHFWCTYWLIVLEEEVGQMRGIGMVGFKGVPNELGEVEIGYGLDSAYHNYGYGTEAVRALANWGLSRPNCKAILAWTMKDNVRSQRVLQKIGMVQMAETAEHLCWRLEKKG